MKKFLFSIFALLISVNLSAQTSGGQIRRPKTTQPKSTPKNNSQKTSSKTKSVSTNSEEEMEKKYQNMSMISLERYASQGDAMAQFYLGYKYAQNGDYKTAVEWYRKAAYKDLIRAQLWLAWCYYHGKGVDKDTYGAREWLKEAASKGSADAKVYLKTWY